MIFDETDIPARNHRGRKENYVKSIEQEVLRLREAYGTICRDRDSFVDENRKLRDLLAQHGIHCPADLAKPLRPVAFETSSSGSFSGSYAEHSPDLDPSPPPPQPGFYQRPSPQGSSLSNARSLPQYNINVDQVGINFVLAYGLHTSPAHPRFL